MTVKLTYKSTRRRPEAADVGTTCTLSQYLAADPPTRQKDRRWLFVDVLEGRVSAMAYLSQTSQH